MRTVISRWLLAPVGVTVGLRKDGSVAVLFDDDEIKWYKADDFKSMFEAV